MSAPPFVLLYSLEVEKLLADMARSAQYADKLKKIRKALKYLREVGPQHPGLQTHRYQSVRGPGGSPLYESYIENNTPSAWRMWWVYGEEADTIFIATVGPHP